MATWEAEHKVWTAKKESLFASLNSVLTYSKGILTKDQATLNQFKLKIRSLDAIRDSFMEAMDKVNIYASQIDPEAVPNYKPIDSFLEIYNTVMMAFEEFSAAVNPSIAPVVQSGSGGSSQLNSLPSSGNVQQSTPKVKLPSLDLPVFNGESTSDWVIFYELFTSMIHNRTDISNAQKVQYLLSRLSGKALVCCSSIPATGQNYNSIFQALVERYNDKRILTNEYLDTLLHFKAGKVESTTSLNTFVEKFGTSVAALRSLELDNLEDCILVHLASSKLAPETIKSFETTLKRNEIPKFDQLLDFIKEHCRMLTRVHNSSSGSSITTSKTTSLQPKQKATHSFFLQESKSKPEAKVKSDSKSKSISKNCFFCNKETHPLFRCEQFCKLSPNDRYDAARKHKLCLNCLSKSHAVKSCSSKYSCSHCGKKHHSLLHFPKKNGSSSETLPTCEDVSKNVVSMCSTVQNAAVKTILLATVKVHIQDKFGKLHVARFLLDCGSQSHFITAKLCDKLHLEYENSSTTMVSGLGSSSRPVLGQVSFNMKSRTEPNCAYSMDALVVESITDKLPYTKVCCETFEHLQNVQLSDDTFGVPGEIHGLIGASLYPYLLLPGQIRSHTTEAVALNTTLGYVIVGSAEVCNPSKDVFCGFIENHHLDGIVQKLWLDEEIVSTKPLLSPSEKENEEFFQNTCYFDSNQHRYCVRLPFKESPEKLDSSYEITQNRFLALERRLEKVPELRITYDKCINDLLKADQLRACSEQSFDGYFVPHHIVVKESSLTTKHRIVFDFSCPTKNGVSLNDLLHSGAKLYNDLFSILLNFRLFKVAIIADISKMFLQIALHPQDHKYQKILWRFSINDPIQTYMLVRVMFGMKCSPFLAQRTIRQLAIDKQDEFPLVNEIVQSSFYMDDLTASLQTVEEALDVQSQLVNCFKSASFNLVKWASNEPALIESVPREDTLFAQIDWNSEEAMKILGMFWSHSTDVFSFGVDVSNSQCTKRTVLSSLAKIWDPLGLISPITLYCKAILQSLWSLKLDWDSPAPSELSNTWIGIISELGLLAKIQLPRHIGVIGGSKLMLLGFSDASERACGAVVYSRSTSPTGVVTVSLLCAKSKVAPLKKISIPRLELNASLLLARLIGLVHDQLNKRYPVERILCFSDSEIALHWIGSSPHKWQTYVANRVTKIQDLTPSESWFHVPGEHNMSADCLSRGLLPSQLLEHPTWFHGPSYLKEDVSLWPISKLQTPTIKLPEEKTVTLVTVNIRKSNFLLEISKRYSSWTKLLNTLVYIFRFGKLLPQKSQIETSDLEFVETRLWLAVQQEHLGKDLKEHSKLSPFIDSNGIIRVGGRLGNSTLPFNSRHPILLPKNEHVVRILIAHLHQKNIHTGPSLLLSILRQNYWILAARPLVRKIVQSCNFCFRLRPRNTTPMMADLPKFRVEEVKPFLETGLDFAGPYYVTLSKNRGVKSQKSYLCLFVCLATKAYHLELVSDLSTEAFLNALKRFLSRRGPVATLHSDNGSNFIGAKNSLNELYKLFASQTFNDDFSQELLKRRITWKTLPANAPHMGGIWERAVQSCKTHIQRVLGEQILTFEELSTVFAQVEALLNSRPLCTLSSDPNELEALTPAHFLNLTPLQHLPAAPVADVATNRLSRFKLLDKLVQGFWKRWRLEYLHTLQEKAKWTSPSTPITVGTIVVIKHEHTPPLQWPLGIVVELFPNPKDKVVRVVKLRTKSGTILRPVVKICPLPSQ